MPDSRFEYLARALELPDLVPELVARLGRAEAPEAARANGVAGRWVAAASAGAAAGYLTSRAAQRRYRRRHR